MKKKDWEAEVRKWADHAGDAAWFIVREKLKAETGNKIASQITNRINRLVTYGDTSEIYAIY